MNIGGPSHHVAILNHGLNARGYETLLVVGIPDEDEGSMLDLAVKKNLQVVVLPQLSRNVSFIKDLWCVYSLVRLFRREKPLIVHTHLSKAGFVGRIAATLAGVPIVVHTYHNFTFRDYFRPWLSRLFLFLDVCCGKITDCIVAISERQKLDLLRFRIANEKKITVIRLGLELNKFLDCQSKTHDVDLSLPRDVLLVGVVGRLVPVKNLHMFLRAAASLRRVRQDIEFVIVGTGYLRLELEKYARSLGIGDVVHLTGGISDVAPIYSRLAVLVVSSDSEGTPVSLIEAMASGCPVVSTAVGGVPDVIKNGQTGRLVARGDSTALANAILAVFDEPERSRQMARSATAFVVQNFGADRLTEDMDKLYERLIKGRVSRSGGKEV
jgi:glycosyltransferase involved in cell wall biosynthesis